MERRRRHLDVGERAVIFAAHRRGTNQREIARLRGRSTSAICRALARGRVGTGPGSVYCPQAGQRASARRRLRCWPHHKLFAGGALWRFVRHHPAKFRWSPVQAIRGQIAATLRSLHPDDRQASVSHETIYAMRYAQPRGGLKAALVEALRQRKHRRGIGRGIGRKPGGGSAIVPDSVWGLHRRRGRCPPRPWPLGGGRAQGRRQPLLGRHSGGAQDPLRHPGKDGGQRGGGGSGSLHPADEAPARLPAPVLPARARPYRQAPE